MSSRALHICSDTPACPRLALAQPRLAAPRTPQPAARLLQRRYGNHAIARAAALARQADGAPTPEVAPETEQAIQQARGGGQALDNAVRGRMESAFDVDFSGVRVHTDARSDSLNRALSARAFTTGQDVFFRQGEYNPASAGGQALLAHELTHVVQQSGTLQTKLTVGAPDDAYEQEAEQVAREVVASTASTVLQRVCACGGAAESDGECAACRQNRQEARRRPADDTDLSRAPIDTIAREPADAGSTAPDTAGAGAAPAAADAGVAACALTTFSGSNLVGEAVTADVEFVDSLETINAHAVANNVDLHVTSSFRTGTNVKGAIVTPATMSNHMAGHAIDMNVKYGEKKDQWCNSGCLGGTLPAGVSGFIKAIQDDAGLRWGGDFKDKDPVHIDDGLNDDEAAWKARYEATQKARKDGCG